MSTTPRRQALRDLLNRRELVIAPGVFDGISAQLARRTGHVAAYMTGAGVAASGFGAARHRPGHPDRDGRARADDRRRTRRCAADRRRRHRLRRRRSMSCAPCGCTTTPASRRSSSRTRRSRSAAATCPTSTSLTPPTFVADAARRLGRRAPTTTCSIVARTDARAPLGLDEAIERANRYAAAGADIIFVEAPQGVDEIERIAREVDAPLLINLVLGGLTPLQSTRGCRSWATRSPSIPAIRSARATFAMLQACANSTAAIPRTRAHHARQISSTSSAWREWTAPRRAHRHARRRPLMGMTIIEKILARKAGDRTRFRPARRSSSTST